MSEENVDLARGMYEAFARGDVPGVLDALAENVSWNSPTLLPHGGIAHGHEEVDGFFERLDKAWEGFELKVEDYVASGDRVCVIAGPAARSTGCGRRTGSCTA